MDRKKEATLYLQICPNKSLIGREVPKKIKPLWLVST